MTQVFRNCPECGGEQLFEPFHQALRDCPDSPSGHCPEWSCTQCGTAVWAGFLHAPARPALLRLPRKVA
jgi:hypothetical protein